jgi:hypothetical protein
MGGLTPFGDLRRFAVTTLAPAQTAGTVQVSNPCRVYFPKGIADHAAGVRA